MNRVNSISRVIKLLLALTCFLTSLPASAEKWSFRAPHDPVPHNADEYEWTEEQVDLPAYPQQEKMLQIDFGRNDARFDYFIDPETLSVGEDGVVHYVILLRSKSGAENVMFEGIRCSKREYKTVAFGTADAKFRVLKSAAWKDIPKTSNNWYRYDLWERFLCPSGNNLKTDNDRDSILQRIKYPTVARPRI